MVTALSDNLGEIRHESLSVSLTIRPFSRPPVKAAVFSTTDRAICDLAPAYLANFLSPLHTPLALQWEGSKRFVTTPPTPYSSYFPSTSHIPFPFFVQYFLSLMFASSLLSPPENLPTGDPTVSFAPLFSHCHISIITGLLSHQTLHLQRAKTMFYSQCLPYIYTTWYIIDA